MASCRVRGEARETAAPPTGGLHAPSRAHHGCIANQAYDVARTGVLVVELQVRGHLVLFHKVTSAHDFDEFEVAAAEEERLPSIAGRGEREVARTAACHSPVRLLLCSVVEELKM